MKENMLRSVNKLRHPRDRRRRRQHRPRPPRHTYDAEALPPAASPKPLATQGMQCNLFSGPRLRVTPPWRAGGSRLEPPHPRGSP